MVFIKKCLKKVIDYYIDKGIAVIVKVESELDDEKIATFSGVINRGTPVFFVAVNISEVSDSNVLKMLSSHIEIIAKFDNMQGMVFALFYENNAWYKVPIEKIKVFWRKPEEFSRNNLIEVKNTAYGPDFLEKIIKPFEVLSNEEKRPGWVFFQ